MAPSLSESARLSRLNSIARPQPAKANLSDNAIVRAAGLVDMAVRRSGTQFKVLGDSPAQTTKKIKGTTAHKLWFHEMLATWPAEVWCELLPLIALEVCKGQFTVKRAVTIEEKSA